MISVTADFFPDFFFIVDAEVVLNKSTSLFIAFVVISCLILRLTNVFELQQLSNFCMLSVVGPMCGVQSAKPTS